MGERNNKRESHQKATQGRKQLCDAGEQNGGNGELVTGGNVQKELFTSVQRKTI